MRGHLRKAVPHTVWGDVVKITARDDAGDAPAPDADWNAMREARARMLRDRIRERAMRDPAVEALGYWAPGYPGAAATPAPPGARD